MTETHSESRAFIPFGYLPNFHQPSRSTIRIYVACLAAYNNGYLHGRWIDAALGESHIWEEIRAMLAASPVEMAEEWAIHDYEGFEGAPISEWESFESVAKMAEFIEEHETLGGKLLEHYCGELEDAQKSLEHYHGQYESLEDYARSFAQECGPKIPDSLALYVDYKSMGRDWEMSGDIFTVETAFDEIHIFGAW
jgi:antirestriction protein